MKSDAEIVKEKARQMLIQKDEELERMRLNKAAAASSSGGNNQMTSPGKDTNTFDSRGRIDSQPDSGASTFSENVMVASVMEADNTMSSQLITESGKEEVSI